MALKLGELAAIIKVDKSQFDRGLAESRAEFKAAGDGMDRDAETSSRSIAAKLASLWRTPQRELASQIDATKSKLHDLADEFARTGEKSLLKDMSQGRSELRQLEQAAKDLGQSAFPAMISGAQSVWSTMGQVGSTVGSAASSLWGLIPIIAGVAAVAALAVPAISLLGGALGSLPAIAVGGGAALGVLGLGFMGLTDQFKQHAAAAGQVVDKEHQVEIAERNLADAQAAALQSQENLNRARQDAKRNIDDLTRSLADQQLQEESAALAVEDARRALLIAQMGGNLDAIKRADLAYRQAQQNLDDTKAKVQETAQAQQDAAAKGVEGSDQVKSALDQQHKATEQLADAQYALEQAHKSQATAAAGAAAETTKLAASAQHLVDVIKSLKGPFDDLRLDVQQRLFAGVGDEVRSLANAWLPTLHSKLGGTADIFNGLIKTFGQSIQKPQFIAEISDAIDAVDRNITKIGQQVAGPLVDAFGQLAGASGPFLDAVGDEVAGLVKDFANWIDKANKSGELKDFFRKAGDFFHDVAHMGKDVGGIIGDIVKALFEDPKNKGGGSTWTDLKKTLDDLKKWFDDPKNQKKIQEWFQELERGGKIFLKVAGWIGDLILWLDKANKKVHEWAGDAGQAISDFADWVGRKWDQVVGFVEGLPGRIRRAVSGMWDGIKDEFREAVNWLIWKWNNLSFTIGGGNFMGLNIPSFTLSTPNIPYLAEGGVVRATPGGRVVGVAEGGQDEAVAPLDKLAAMIRANSAGTATVVLDTRGDAVLDALFAHIRYKVRFDYGGNVNAAFVGT